MRIVCVCGSDTSSKGEGTKCGVVEAVKHSILRWHDHLEGMGRDELTKKMYMSKVDPVSTREQP